MSFSNESSYLYDKFHQWSHQINATIKDKTNGKVNLDWIYGKERWDSDTDRKQASRHKEKASDYAIKKIEMYLNFNDSYVI